MVRFHPALLVLAEVAELADAPDLKSGIRNGCAGSSPAFGTILYILETDDNGSQVSSTHKTVQRRNWVKSCVPYPCESVSYRRVTDNSKVWQT